MLISPQSLIRLLCAAFLSAPLFAAEPPVIPVGLDAYRQWERWPYQRIGARTYMRSTYDRRGGNEGADASHFLFQLADDFNVSLDVEGPGVLYFARYNHWHGSPWHYVIDGADHLLQESNTADPTKRLQDSAFLPEALFPMPLSLDLVHDQRRRLELGANAVREIVSHGLLANALRHRLLHLPAVRARHPAFPADLGGGWPDSSG